jgi:hypothetical protein
VVRAKIMINRKMLLLLVGGMYLGLFVASSGCGSGRNKHNQKISREEVETLVNLVDEDKFYSILEKYVKSKPELTDENNNSRELYDFFLEEIKQ